MKIEKPGRVLMITLDAAEPSLIEAWMDQGLLPNLAGLRARGACGRLASSAASLAGSPWPTFYTGTMPGDHGIYHILQWRPDRMIFTRPSPEWLPLRPFWRDLGHNGKRVVAIDLPMTYPPEPFNGVEISGWATHDLLSPAASYPEELFRKVRRQYGPSPMKEEVGGLQKAEALLRLRDDLNRATKVVLNLSEELMLSEPWDLFLVGFGATHRGGHKLWNLPAEQDPSSPKRSEPSHALRDIYVACDQAVGRLVEAAGESTHVLVFSLHGMGPNIDRSNLVATMLTRILEGDAGSNDARSPGLIDRARKLIPVEWRTRVKVLLPPPLQDRLTLFWRTRDIDWRQVRAFSLMADLQGYVRINVRGREAAGIVEAGDEYLALCAQIEEGLKTFRDADTGEPLVTSVVRTSDLFPQGRRCGNLPDLLVHWATTPSAAHRALTSPRYGAIAWPTPGRNPDGRSGNHRFEGFLVAAGEHIRPGSKIHGAHITDLAPTACALLGVSPPPAMRGKVLPVVGE